LPKKKRIKKIAIIGGGSASFIAADFLSQNHQVIIYERGKTIGRKFLVAGKGGFNISHQMDTDELIQKYNPTSFLASCLQHFDVDALRNWYAEIGIPTYIGSSSRIFPEKGISPADVLRKIKARLTSRGVEFKYGHEFVGFSNSTTPIIKHQNEEFEIIADHYLFALGGASWKVTGSDGHWLESFAEIGVGTRPFEASNCGLNISWPSAISQFHIGKPLKNIEISHGDLQIKGEALITEYGIEGNAIYPISSTVRETLHLKPSSTIIIDFKPMLSALEIHQKIKSQRPSNYAQKLKLDSTVMSIIKSYMPKEDYLNPERFAQQLKCLEIPISTLRPIEEAISTVGGIDIEELNPDFSLKAFPHISCIGEMVNWDAPTGGFLLQACFSMSAWAARSI
jgi:uncharacterized flavoprotein (TIGR03862 family)